MLRSMIARTGFARKMLCAAAVLRVRGELKAIVPFEVSATYFENEVGSTHAP